MISSTQMKISSQLNVCSIQTSKLIRLGGYVPIKSLRFIKDGGIQSGSVVCFLIQPMDYQNQFLNCYSCPFLDMLIMFQVLPSKYAVGHDDFNSFLQLSSHIDSTGHIVHLKCGWPYLAIPLVFLVTYSPLSQTYFEKGFAQLVVYRGNYYLCSTDTDKSRFLLNSSVNFHRFSKCVSIASHKYIFRK